MHKWILKEDKGKYTKIYCAECTKKKYDNLMIRVQWTRKEVGKTFTCEDCGYQKIIEDKLLM